MKKKTGQIQKKTSGQIPKSPGGPTWKQVLFRCRGHEGGMRRRHGQFPFQNVYS